MFDLDSVLTLPYFRNCVVLIDGEDRIFGVLGGVPRGSVGSEWQNVAQQAASAIKLCFDASTFTSKEQMHRRGDFTARCTGIGFGGGRQVVGMMKISGKKNINTINQLLQNLAIQRIVGFTNCMHPFDLIIWLF